MSKRAMAAALTVSVLAHALVLGGAEWRWPSAPGGDALPVIQARLVTPPAPLVAVQPVPAPVAQPAPQPRPAPRPRPVTVAKTAVSAPVVDVPDEPLALPAAPETVDPASALASAALAAAAEPPPPAATPATDNADSYNIEGWPTHGAILFRVAMGEGNFVVGEAEHEWWHDDTRYRMQVTLQTTGLVGMVRGFHYVQRSEGEVGAQGLKPQRFQVEQRGKAPESAEFDWAAGRVSIRRGERERRSAAVRAGDQDVLSLWHQIGIVGAAGLPTTLTVASNKDAKVALLEKVGEETLRLPIGRLDTLRLRAQSEDGKLTIDIWLARNYGMLPVRIRIVDDKGEMLDQQAVRLRLAPPEGEGDKTPGAPADGTAPRAGGEPEMIELKEEVDPLAGLQQN
ncbi:hypothetical protein dqs_3255 [Azoarcus olearius]|uniref:DUF3108 domain-containing protein n=1 Tax=Azoarcus sp. (strain BH72) TaxID=418699 RepID=UPI0008060D19|nr:DUF3108 domain-containing protein [Azoarcus olearius]ANQ86282.1 hypothetical protein dqs_3255 [Azoarcus olearius]